MKLTTLCYIEKNDSYLMLHRVKKKKDINKDKWIGVGGHFEINETPEECLIREVKEETGLTLLSYELRGIVTFILDNNETEYMFLYTSKEIKGEICKCDEGELKWIKKSQIYSLNIWSGDEIFFMLLEDNVPFFSLKLVYSGDKLVKSTLNSKNLELFDIVDSNGMELNKVKERKVVHRVGYFHKTVHTWLIRKQDNSYQVLLQKRCKDKDSFPEYYDISSAGHMCAGDDYENAAIRELSEELGIIVKQHTLKLIGTHKGIDDKIFYGKPFHNYEISNVYIYDTTNEFIEFKLQAEEVESVLWIDYLEGKKILENQELKNCIYMDEWKMLTEYIEELIKLEHGK